MVCERIGASKLKSNSGLLKSKHTANHLLTISDLHFGPRAHLFGSSSSRRFTGFEAMHSMTSLSHSKDQLRWTGSTSVGLYPCVPLSCPSQTRCIPTSRFHLRPVGVHSLVAQDNEKPRRRRATHPLVGRN